MIQSCTVFELDLFKLASNCCIQTYKNQLPIRATSQAISASKVCFSGPWCTSGSMQANFHDTQVISLYFNWGGVYLDHSYRSILNFEGQKPFVNRKCVIIIGISDYVTLTPAISISDITQICLCNILQYFMAVKIGNFQMKKCDRFLIFAQNIDRVYTLEPPH